MRKGFGVLLLVVAAPVFAGQEPNRPSSPPASTELARPAERECVELVVLDNPRDLAAFYRLGEAPEVARPIREGDRAAYSLASLYRGGGEGSNRGTRYFAPAWDRPRERRGLAGVERFEREATGAQPTSCQTERPVSKARRSE